MFWHDHFGMVQCTHAREHCATVQAGKWQLASRFFGEFRQSQVVDLISYNAMMSACEKGSNWQMALHVFLDMYKTPGFQGFDVQA